MNHGTRITDWGRIFFGKVPPVFMAEVLVRALVMYLVLLFTLRFLGKRMNAQLSIIDLAVMISLGAIVSVPMESPKQGLLPGFVLLFLILAFHRGIGYLSLKFRKANSVFYGTVSILVKDGVMQVPDLEHEMVSKNQLFAQLRFKNITQLGEVTRVYREPNGMFSIFRAASPKPGLSTLPEKDDPDIAAQNRESGLLVCANCGTLAGEHSSETDACKTCHHHHWTQAVT